MARCLSPSAATAPLPFSLPHRRRRSISPSPSRLAGTAPHRRVIDGGTAATTTTTVLSSPLPVGLDDLPD
uniref:Uncharacterized protein n=1 Tax=Oryza meridionalis TaxID=40149 RepID=A0A0E0CZM3_9ORYZ